MNETSPPHLAAQKKSMGTGSKVAIGCGIAALVLILCCGIGGFVGYQWIRGKITEFETEFAELGLKKAESGQQITITQAPLEPSYYMAQQMVLDFSQPVTVPVGALAQILEVRGTYEQDVYFRAQIIQLSADAVFKGNVNVYCQAIQDSGATIEGELQGEYTKVNTE